MSLTLLLFVIQLICVQTIFEECTCPSLQMSTICPTSKCQEPVENNCMLACPTGTMLYYKTGLPWKRATNISCNSGQYHADISNGFANLWHITCAQPPSCHSCDEIPYTPFCPDGFLCENALSEVRLNDCSRVSCREGSLFIIHPNQTYTEVFTLQCSEGGIWLDVHEKVHRNVSQVTCAMQRSCQTCRMPSNLNTCKEASTCFNDKLTLQNAKLGNCRIATCNEREFMISSRSLSNETIVEPAMDPNGTIIDQKITLPATIHAASQLSCNNNGEWTVDKFEDNQYTTITLGFAVEAICYWPNCKRCWIEEMDCPPGELCSIDWMNEPDRTQECDVATCKDGTELVFRDEFGLFRTVQSLRCNDEAEWVVVPKKMDVVTLAKKVSLFDENDYVDGSDQLKAEQEALTPPVPTELRTRKARVTCKKIVPSCQRCPDLTVSTVCPGGPERGCRPVNYTGGPTEDKCRVLSCGPESVLWSYTMMRWNEFNTYLECTESGEWKLPGGVIVPSHAEIQCKYNGECQCAGARLGTSTKCESAWETGCDYGAVDLFAREGDCSVIQCRYNGKMAIYQPETKQYVKTVEGKLTCAGSGVYLDQYGNQYTYLDSAVTCHSWEGPRHCARACTWAPQDSNMTVFTEWNDENGCRNLRCSATDIMQVHDTEANTWLTRESLLCTQAGYWTSKEDRGAMLFPYKVIDKNFVEVRCQGNKIN